MQGKNCVNFLITFMGEMEQCLTKLKVMAHQRSQVSPPICTSLHSWLCDAGAGSAAGGWPGLDISSGRGNVGQRTYSTSNRSSVKPFTSVFAPATIKWDNNSGPRL